jgi:hypothetical protein
MDKGVVGWFLLLARVPTHYSRYCPEARDDIHRLIRTTKSVIFVGDSAVTPGTDDASWMDLGRIMLFVRHWTGRCGAAVCAGLAASWLFQGCAGSPSQAPAPSNIGSTPSTPAATSLNLTGTWTGSGSDGLGPETFSWVLAQSGNALSGSVSMRPLSATDGSCESCHKVKDGSISGSVSGTTVTLRMSFDLGGSQPTPTCLVVMDVSASNVTSTSLASSYNGSDSCEPAVALGSITMTRH